MAKPNFQNVVIVGTGLIGASLGRDLRRLGIARRITGIDANPHELLAARRAGAITAADQALPCPFKGADLVILALPVRAIIDFIRQSAPCIPSRTIVLDVGSTKQSVVRAAERAFKAGNFVGCHPMAGSEKPGAAASRAGLFNGRTCFITPGRNSKPAVVRRVTALWRAVGARPVVETAAHHDALVAWISHLPQMVSSTLMAASRPFFARTPAANKYIGGGFIDTTRIADSPSALWRDILLENRDHALATLRSFRNELEKLERALRDSDADALTGFLEAAARARRGLKL